MRINPISSGITNAIPIQFFKPKKIKSSTKTTKSSKTKKIEKNNLQNDILDPINFSDGDPDSSQSLWGDSTQFFEKECENQNFDFKKILTDAQWISELYSGEIKNQGNWYKNPKIALHQVSIYEAILYDALLHNRWPKMPTQITVKPILNYTRHQLSFTMSLRNKEVPIESYKIIYYLSTQKIKLWDKHNKLIGKFDIIIRNRCLEEIQGTLYNTPLLLDPIWSSNNSVKSERIRFGTAKAEVFTSANTIQISLIDQNGIKIPIKINDIRSIFVDKGIFLTRKEITIKNYRLSINQLFLIRFAIPFRFNTTITSI